MKVSLQELIFIACVLEQYRLQVGYATLEEAEMGNIIEAELVRTIDSVLMPDLIDLNEVECYNRLMV